jgi:hypothetical protein
LHNKDVLLKSSLDMSLVKQFVELAGCEKIEAISCSQSNQTILLMRDNFL